MKYLKIIIPISILILGIGITLLFFLQKPHTPTQTKTPYNPFAEISNNPAETPDAYTTAFYTWYLQVLSNDQNFSSSPNFKSSISQWLTPEFVANWNSIVENTDQNPVLLSQDTQDSWASNIRTALVNQSTTDSTVEVSLGTTPNQQILLVHLVHNENQWRIASVDLAAPN
jgi:hypothetical protein